MKMILSALLLISLFVSSLALGAVQVGDSLKNGNNPEITMIVMASTPEGVPTIVGFAKGKEVMTLAKVSENSDPIDIAVGEVYDVTGPQTEGDVCNLNAKMSFVDEGIKIDFDRVQVGAEFFQYCADLSSLSGVYKK